MPFHLFFEFFYDIQQKHLTNIAEKCNDIDGDVLYIMVACRVQQYCGSKLSSQTLVTSLSPVISGVAHKLQANRLVKLIKTKRVYVKRSERLTF